jgi:multidrug resistance efflux pump
MKDKLARIRLDPSERSSPKRVSPDRRLWAIAIAAALVVLLAVGLVLSRRQAPEESANAASRTGDLAATQSPATGNRDSSPRTLSAGGFVEAKRTALVWPGREGIVARVHVFRGQEVREGDLLLELDARAPAAAVEKARAELNESLARLEKVREGARAEELAAARAEVDEAEVQLADARADLERLRQLGKSELISTAELDQARYRAAAAVARAETLRSNLRLLEVGSRPSEIAGAEAEVARKEAALREAEVSLDLTRVRSPFDGRVIAIELEPGEVVSLFDVRSGIEVADESELWVRVDVPESRLHGLRLGDAAEVIAQAVGSEPLDGRVVEIAPKADRQSNTVQVAVAIEDPPPVLRPDMSARVNITVSGEEP